VDTLFVEGGYLAAAATVDDIDLRVGVDLLHEPDAARAENASLAVEHQRRTEVHVALDAFTVEHAAREIHAALRRPERVREVLKRALAALVAYRTIERMVDEEELENAGSSGDDLGIARRDHHAVGARRGARRLQLRHLLDLHHADAARTVDAKARVITVVGERNPVLDGGLQDRSALFDRKLPAIDGQ
jgi:hypothetical protein